MSQLVVAPAQPPRAAGIGKLLHRIRKNLRAGWLVTFPQKSTRERMIDLVITMLILKTRHTIAAAAIYDGRDQDKNWTPDYRLFSTSSWSERDLMRPCLEKGLSMLDPNSRWVTVAMDDVKVYKTGKKIPDTSIQRDSMSPPFHTNLRLAQRFFHAALILPHYLQSPELRARAIPVRFHLSPVLKKPGKKATPEQRQEYKERKKTHNLSVDAGVVIQEVRQDMDRAGYASHILLCAADGGYCNRNVFSSTAQIDRTRLLVRCRRDAVLAMPAAAGSRKVYSDDKFTPNQIRTDERHSWQSVEAFYAGRSRQVEFKRVDNVLWQRGAKRTRLTLFVLKPLPYKPCPNGPTYYRDPAYLLTDATDIPSHIAIQSYLDRWQIEVAHRELKQNVGLGQGQVRNARSVRRLPAAIAASYSMMYLSALEVYGPARTSDYRPLPAWRRDQARPTCQDIIDLLATQLQQERAAPGYRPPRRRTRPPVPRAKRAHLGACGAPGT